MGSVGPLKECVDREVSTEDEKSEKYVERHLSAYHRRMRTLQQVHFSIGERAVRSPAEFIRGLLRHRSGGTLDRLLFRI